MRTAEESPRLARIAELDHEPIAFVSGKFKKHELRWGTIDKEAYALKTVMLKFEHLLWRQKGVICITDHSNLEFLFGQEHPIKLPTIVKDKLHRWYLRLQGIPYKVRYLTGDHNDWADMLSRWGSSEDKETEEATGEDYVNALTCSLWSAGGWRPA
eukprot:GHVU01035976.1.p1 GENE.GHVU01035976.1~~GHVU01035976.1.p1  ORF type:complete len:183 (-),score=23.52 GHVU01035976.1:56-523(-)